MANDIFAPPSKHEMEDVGDVFAPPSSDELDSANQKEEVIQEQHPKISVADRLVIKNFATDPNVGVAFLKRKYPDLEVKQIRGQTVIKGPKENSWKVLDPDTGFFSSDFLADTGDVAYDIAAGVGTGAATSAGAAGGLPGAIGAGAASSSGAEALRQKIGQALGLPQEMDAKEIGVQGALGGVLPVAGAGLKAGYKTATRSMAPSIAEKLSGVPKQAYKDFAANPETLANFDKNPAALEDLVVDTSDKIISQIKNKKDQVWKNLEGVYKKAEDAGKTVDISPIKNTLNEKIAKAEAAYAKKPTDANLAQVDALKEVRDTYFVAKTTNEAGEEVATEIANVMSPLEALNLKKQLKSPARVLKGTNAAAKTESVADQDVILFGKDAMAKLNKELHKIDPELGRLNERYADLSDVYEEVLKNFEDPKKALATMRGMDSKGREILKLRLEQMFDKPEELQKALQTIQTQTFLGNPASMPLSGFGTTSTSRTIPGEALGEAAGAIIGTKAGGGSYTGTILGKQAGGALGAASFSPKAFKAMIESVLGAEKASSKVGPKTRYGTGMTLLEALKQRQD